MKNTLKALAVAAAVMASSAAVSAEHGLGYVGIAGGVAQTDINCGGSCDDTDVGFKLYGGLRLDKNLAVEATYFNFGAATYSDLAGNDFAEAQGSAFALGVAFSYDFTRWLTGTARFGLGRNKATLETYGAGSDSETKTKPYFGLGLGVRVNNALSFDASYDLTKFEYDYQKSDTQMFSVGARLSF